LYHGITDTNLTLLPLPNEFFFGVFLKHRTTLSYRTLDPSARYSRYSVRNKPSQAVSEICKNALVRIPGGRAGHQPQRHLPVVI